jgi:hypothetical protein
MKVRGLLVAGLVLAAGSARAAFLDPLWSARVAALGGAYTALSDDSVAVFYNPAATARMEMKSAGFSYAKLFAGVDDVDLSLSQVSYLHPLTGFNTLGVGWGSANASRLRREDTVVVSLAHEIREIPALKRLAVGVSARWLSQAYTLDDRTSSDPVFRDGRGRRDTAVDVHLFLPEVSRAPVELSAGLSVRSLNRPNVGFSETERLPVETAGGVALRWKNWTLPLDLVGRGGDFKVQAGLESALWNRRLALRAGTDTDQAGAGFGLRLPVSVRTTLIIDYAFLWPLKIQDTSGSHRATVGLTF